MQIKTILNRILKHPGFVCGTLQLEAQAAGLESDLDLGAISTVLDQRLDIRLFARFSGEHETRGERYVDLGESWVWALYRPGPDFPQMEPGGCMAEGGRAFFDSGAGPNPTLSGTIKRS